MKSISCKEPFKVRISFCQLFPHSSHVVWKNYTFYYDNFEDFHRFVQEVSHFWPQPDSSGILTHITSTSTPNRPFVRWSSKTRKPIGFGRKDFTGYFSDKDMFF